MCLAMTLCNTILVLLCVIGAVKSEGANKENNVFTPGFGVTRLKSHYKKHGVHKTEGYRSYAVASCDNVKEYRYNDAVVDNFAPIDKQQKWYEGQRYWLNRQFWGGPGAPIFVYIGGEGAESCSRLTDHMYAFDLAQQHNALLVNVEHRFYGESYPTHDMSTENLGYLSADQALADLARIIGFLKEDLNAGSSKVVTIGGSYPGNLAAWFRLKYPSVTQGSIASSAPVTAKANFEEYMDVVGQSIQWFSGQKCYDAIEVAADAVAKMVYEGSAAGLTQVGEDFKTCGPISNDLDLAVLMSDLMGNVQGTVQYNNEHDGVMNITDICTTMLAGDDAYTQFVQLQSLYREANGQDCEDSSWEDTVTYLSAPEMDGSNAARPWTYQTCNEFGYFQTTDSANQPFHSWKSLSLQFSEEICSASFNGWKAMPQTSWVNQKYGEVLIAGTNIALVSGTIDPWHALGVTNATASLLPQPTEHSVFIQGTAHCNDLYAPASSDPQSLTNAREQIADLVSQWLK